MQLALDNAGRITCRYKSTFNISIVVDSSASAECSVADISKGDYKYSGGACFAATSNYRQPSTGYEIVGRIDGSRFTTMEHSGAPNGAAGQVTVCL
jgi:hypothetical protein